MLFGEVGDPLGQARSLGNTGMVEEHAGRFQVTARLCARALVTCDEAGDVTVRAHLLTRLGASETRIGEVEAPEPPVAGDRAAPPRRAPLRRGVDADRAR